MLRVRDVMREDFPQAGDGEPVREVGRLMAREDLDLVPIVDDDGALAGVMTERALARRYIRESREPSELDAPTTRRARSSRVLAGRAASAATTARSRAGSGAWRWTSARCRREIGPGDVVVVGNRDDAQRAAIELGVGAAGHQQRHAPDRRDARARAASAACRSSPRRWTATSPRA